MGLDDTVDPVPDAAAPIADPAFERLLDYLKDTRAFDFTGYKRASLARRVQHQMRRVGVSGFEEYLDHLQVHPAEFTMLFNTILINVTDFFRDRDAWEALATEVVPELLATVDDGPIRVWSAACATGQEAYSIAMVLAEALGPERYRQRVKIYATDVDEDALGFARLATYTAAELTGLPEGYAEKYFEAHGERFQFRPDLRRNVIFGRNDLISDAPISRIDLLLCRNSLMYFNAEVQQRIIARLTFALKPNGVLFLGKAEMLLNHASAFEPVDLKRRFFRKRVLDPRASAPAQPSVTAPAAQPPTSRTTLAAETFHTSPVPQLVVDLDGILVLLNDAANTTLGLSSRDLNRPFHDLEISYRPAELRSVIETVRRDRAPVWLRGVRWHRSARDVATLDVLLVPLTDPTGRLLGVAVSFVDVSRERELSDELEIAGRQLETAYEELQSTNEELETTNEELQSMNDELHLTNEELRYRTALVTGLNTFLESILAGLSSAVIVLDADLRVQVWNQQAEELWGLREAETVGEHFLNLDSGLPTDALRPAIREVTGGAGERAELTTTAVNRRGRRISVRVVVTAVAGVDGVASGALLLMDPAADGV